MQHSEFIREITLFNSWQLMQKFTINLSVENKCLWSSQVFGYLYHRFGGLATMWERGQKDCKYQRLGRTRAS